MRWSLVVAACLAFGRVAYGHPAVTKPCASCHEDLHRGELGTRCDGCHTTTAWAPSTYGLAQHVKYPLDGRHVGTPCSGCHRGERPRVTFVIPQRDCLDCHANPHGTKFSKEMVEAGCVACHTTGTWKAWRVDHRAWPLTGGHTRTACAACHPGTDPAAPASAFRGVPRACEQCHDDTHAGQFRGVPVKACTDCHSTETFRGPFDHARTRYPLEGVHADLACVRCHPTTDLRNGERAVRWRLGYAACSACHASPHPRIAVTTIECSACHGSTSWKEISGAGAGFDHATTGFALRGAHASTACMGCHAKGTRPPSACEACHRNTHQGRLTGPCAECHTAVAWSDVRTLEQHRRTRMPLTGKHAILECTACHRRQSDRAWSDLPVDCFACHGERYRRAQPDHDGPLAFSRNCAQCHFTVAWSPAFDPTLLRASTNHDASFVLAGSHRATECASCHVDERRRKLVRCDGCHTTGALRTQHRTRITAVAADCLRCHPRGARR